MPKNPIAFMSKADKLAMELRKHRRLLDVHLERGSKVPSGIRALERARAIVADLEQRLAEQKVKDAAAAAIEAEKEARALRRRGVA